MEDIEFCKADFLYMLSELNEAAVESEEEVKIEHHGLRKEIFFMHFNEKYRNKANTLCIYRDIDTHDTAYEKYERMMKCMKEGALLVD